MIFVALLALLFVCFACLARLGLPDVGPSEAVIHTMGEQLVTGIEKWHLSHGRYPSSLAEAGLASPTDYSGGFQYEGESAGFVLWIGVADGVNVRHAYHSNGISKEVSQPGWFCMD